MRIDTYLALSGRAPSRSRAQAMIESGVVFQNGYPVKKASSEVKDGDEISIEGAPPPYVGRGGLKLEAALDAFRVDAEDKTAADIGASTGGFTDCLLKRGAAKVYAVDSGRGQLHSSLLNDSRVISLEGLNARTLSAEALGERCDIVVMDVSFISQTLLYGAVDSILKDDGVFISLIKPQFEAGRAFVGKNGIVKDESAHIAVIRRVIDTAGAFRLRCRGVIRSPVRGGDGNREYLALFLRGDESGAGIEKRYIEDIVRAR